MQETKKKKYYGYIVVLWMALLMLPGSLIMSAASIFYTPVTEELGVSLAAFGMNLTIVQLVCAFACPTLFTPLAKKIKLRWLLALSMVLEAVAFAIRAVATNIWTFYFSSVLISLPMGLLFNVCLPIVANTWFPKKVGLAIGVMGCTQGLGGMLFSSIGGALIGSHGWRFTTWIWVLVCVIAAPITALIMRDTPEEVGQKAPGTEDVAVAGGSAATELTGMSRVEALKSPAFWLCALAIAVGSFACNVHSFINPYCLSVGMSSALSGFISGLIQAGVFCNKLLLGWICDKFGAKVGALYYTIGGMLCFTIILLSQGATALVALGCFLIGPLYASANLYGPILVKYMFGQKDFSNIWALTVMIFCTSGALGSTLWGLILEVIDYSGAFKIAIALVALVLLMLLSVFSMRKNLVKKWTPSK